MYKTEILSKLKELKIKFENDGFNIVGFFGSYAKGNAKESSDIDILYSVNEKFLNKYKGFSSVSKIFEIEKELSKIFNKEIHLSSLSGMNERVKEKINKEIIYA